jgi:hypothetical protein
LAFFPLGGGFTAISPRMASSKSASMIGGLGLVAEIIIITVSSSLLGVKRLQSKKERAEAGSAEDRRDAM